MLFRSRPGAAVGAVVAARWDRAQASWSSTRAEGREEGIVSNPASRMINAHTLWWTQESLVAAKRWLFW